MVSLIKNICNAFVYGLLIVSAMISMVLTAYILSYLIYQTGIQDSSLLTLLLVGIFILSIYMGIKVFRYFRWNYDLFKNNLRGLNNDRNRRT